MSRGVSRSRKSKVSSAYVCQACGHTERRWLGKCPQCSEWNSLIEEIQQDAAPRSLSTSARHSEPIAIADVKHNDNEHRVATGVGELDRVLGGGLVAGSIVLLGGEPGIGKSTLLMQALAKIASRGANVLYVSGEESVAQTAMRARRVSQATTTVKLLAETNLERILATARIAAPAVLAVDSIQTLHTDALESIPGSVGQVRECSARLLTYAKTSNVPTIIVGHVTKEGGFAGPKTLEHVVDAVLQFEGEGASPYRVLRAYKNRFGSTQELGVFEMAATGLNEVLNPSQLFLAERPQGAPGSVVVASAEGSRPILVEVQALVAPPAASVGRRTAAGVDGNRVALLLAVLAQRAGCDVLVQDVFVNVAGGVRLTEPAVDLGIACALASSARGRAIDARTVVFGEIGLAGEVRAVNLAEIRLAEAAKLGFQRAIVPEQNRARLSDTGDDAGLELVGVKRLEDALDTL